MIERQAVKLKFNLAIRRPPGSRQGFVKPVALVQACLIIAALGIGTIFVVRHYVQSSVCNCVEDKLNELLSVSGFWAELGKASFEEGRGIRIDDFALPDIAETTSVWTLPLSLAATHRITLVFSSSGYLDVSVHRVRSALRL